MHVNQEDLFQAFTLGFCNCKNFDLSLEGNNLFFYVCVCVSTVL